MHQITDIFQYKGDESGKTSILDMCMAPGGFLAMALGVNPKAQAIGFSLPGSEGGHKNLLPKQHNVSIRYLDITMLATDMGRTEIPADHPDAGKFLPCQFIPGQLFDLVICDGQVLRTHDRHTYRAHQEAARLNLTQLALGLEHIKPGETMLVLLHTVELPQTVRLPYAFEKFSKVKLFKNEKFHAKRSSFYMLATDIQSDRLKAMIAIRA